MTNDMSWVNAGATEDVARLGGVYSGTFASKQNVDSTETVFISRTMPAGFWPSIGTLFLIESVITTVTQGPGRHLRVYVFEEPSYESGAFNAEAGGALHIRLNAFRISSSTLAVFTNASGVSITDYTSAQYTEHTVDFTAPITISVRGQAQATGDVVYRVGHSRYYPPPAVITLP